MHTTKYDSTNYKQKTFDFLIGNANWMVKIFSQITLVIERVEGYSLSWDENYGFDDWLAAVSIFSSVGSITYRIDLGAERTGLGTGFIVLKYMLLLWLCFIIRY